MGVVLLPAWNSGILSRDVEGLRPEDEAVQPGSVWAGGQPSTRGLLSWSRGGSGPRRRRGSTSSRESARPRRGTSTGCPWAQQTVWPVAVGGVRPSESSQWRVRKSLFQGWCLC